MAFDRKSRGYRRKIILLSRRQGPRYWISIAGCSDPRANKAPFADPVAQVSQTRVGGEGPPSSVFILTPSLYGF